MAGASLPPPVSQGGQASFGQRDAYNVLLFADKLWIIGGYFRELAATSDIWRLSLGADAKAEQARKRNASSNM